MQCWLGRPARWVDDIEQIPDKTQDVIDSKIEYVTQNNGVVYLLIMMNEDENCFLKLSYNMFVKHYLIGD